MSLKVLEILVPTRREMFEDTLADTFGGFTHAGLRFGLWKDGDGKVHRDENIAYHVACEGRVSLSGFLWISAAAFIVHHATLHFPKERAFYVAEIGKATLYAGKAATLQDKVIGFANV